MSTIQAVSLSRFVGRRKCPRHSAPSRWVWPETDVGSTAARFDISGLAGETVDWIVMPADEKQNWGEEWVGFKPSGQFVGSARCDRLVGWKSGGDVIIGPDDADRRRRVESLFHADHPVPPARDN